MADLSICLSAGLRRLDHGPGAGKLGREEREPLFVITR